MKLLLLFYFLSAMFRTQSIDKDTIKLKVYHKGLENHANVKDLYEELKDYEGNDAELQAYKGVVTAIMAEIVFLPITKLSYFNKGKNIIEKTIQSNPKNTELRYLRFIIQVNAPSFLGYSNKINEDKSLFLQNMDFCKNNKGKDKILLYLQNSKNLTTEEKNKINTIFSKF